MLHTRRFTFLPIHFSLETPKLIDIWKYHSCNKNMENVNTAKHAVFLAMTFMMMRADSSIKDANVV